MSRLATRLRGSGFARQVAIGIASFGATATAMLILTDGGRIGLTG